MHTNDPHVSKEHEALPSSLREAVNALKQSTEHLDSEIEQRLLRARQAAVQAAEAKSRRPHASVLTLPWIMFNTHRLVGVGMLSICALLSISLFQVTQPVAQIDTMLLSADLPPEAFTDNAFEPWLKIKKGA